MTYCQLQVLQTVPRQVRQPPSAATLPLDQASCSCLRTWADGPLQRLALAASPVLLSYKNSSKPPQSRGVSPQPRGRVRLFVSGSKGPHPSSGPATPFPAGCLQPFPGWSAPGPCLRFSRSASLENG